MGFSFADFLPAFFRFERWLCGDIIGEGAFGNVHMGLNVDTGEIMAVKILSLDDGDLSSAAAQAFQAEIAILRDHT